MYGVGSEKPALAKYHVVEGLVANWTPSISRHQRILLRLPYQTSSPLLRVESSTWRDPKARYLYLLTYPCAAGRMKMLNDFLSSRDIQSLSSVLSNFDHEHLHDYVLIPSFYPSVLFLTSAIVRSREALYPS